MHLGSVIPLLSLSLRQCETDLQNELAAVPDTLPSSQVSFQLETRLEPIRRSVVMVNETFMLALGKGLSCLERE